jgi:tRNA pseudouridine38-40 synthase
MEDVSVCFEPSVLIHVPGRSNSFAKPRRLFFASLRNVEIEAMRSLRRIRLTLAYDGTDFHGWQVQSGLATIQGTLEEIVSAIEGGLVVVYGSGRTDAGVHAEAQVAAFSITNPIPVENLRRALNRLLPPSIRILRTEEAALDFHPRFDATAKTYEYRLHRGEVCSPFEWRYVQHHPYPLSLERMMEAAAVFQGEHDFTAFAASDERDARGKSKVRSVFHSAIETRGALVCYRVQGSGFLKHMVRNLMGAIVEAGKGNFTVEELRAFLDPRHGRKCGHSMPAKGLHLISVEYGPKPQNDTLAL